MLTSAAARQPDIFVTGIRPIRAVGGTIVAPVAMHVASKRKRFTIPNYSLAVQTAFRHNFTESFPCLRAAPSNHGGRRVWWSGYQRGLAIRCAASRVPAFSNSKP
jgi:hypothetical protein